MSSISLLLGSRWKLALAVALVVLLLSLALLVFTLLPAGETARVQATLAPTLFVPPGAP